MFCYCTASKVLLILVNLGMKIPYYPASGKLRHGPQFFTQKSEGGGLSLNAFALES